MNHSSLPRLHHVMPELQLMHFKMNFVSCIGTLMADSVLKAILCRAFGLVEKMLEGKKYPQNVCVLRLLTEELLRPVIENKELKNMASLEGVLTDLSAKTIYVKSTKCYSVF